MYSLKQTVRIFSSVGRNHALRRVLLAFLIFNTAEWATWVAMLVYAFDRGGASAAGLVAVIQLVPAIFVAPLGSTMGDRLPREKALALGYLIQSGAMAATALSLFVDAPIGVIYLCAALSNCAITLTRPVHHAILPELAETPPELTASNSASSTLEGLSVFIGPVLTGILLAEEGAWLVFAVTSAGVLVAAAMTVGLRRHLALVPAGRVSASIVQDAREGFRQLREDRGATLLTLLVGAQFVVVGMLDVLAVVLALEILGMGPAGPGLMTAAAGIGGLLGAAGTAVLIGRHRMAPAVAAGMLATGGCLALVAVAPGPAMAAAFLIGCGMGKAFFDVASRTLLQRTVDDEVLSRVFGLQEAMLMAGLAVGSAMAPVFVALFGARGAFVAAGALLPLAGLLSRARLREVDDRARVPGVELDLLRRIALFAPLAQPVLERVSWHLIPLEVGAGEVLMRQGEPGDRFYVIAEGQATVEVDHVTVAHLRSGGYVGEIALLRDVPRTATVRAATDLRLLALDRVEFLAAVTGSRPSAVAANQEVDRRLRQNRRLTGRSTDDELL